MEQIRTYSKELASIVESQQVIIDDILKVLPANHSMLNSLKSDLASISLESLRILVFGKIACGKSQLINAMIGSPLVPHRHSPILLPNIVEFINSTTDKAILHPANGNSPFEIQLDKIRTYFSILENDKLDECPFSKLEIHSDKCKSDVSFIDMTLAWDYTFAQQFQTNEHLSKIDSVIYCMRADQAYSAIDKDNIEMLRSLGYTSFVFVLTFWDALLYNDEMMGTNDAQATKEYLLKRLIPLTDLGEDGIFFVDSLGAIKGKINKDQEIIEKSGILQLDRHIDNLITNNKKVVISKIASINRCFDRYISDMARVLWQNNNYRDQQGAELNGLIYDAKQKIEEINVHIDKELKAIAGKVRVEFSKYICSDLISNVNLWVDEAQPEISLNILHLRKSMTEYVEAIISHVQVKVSSMLSNWYQHSPYIESQFNNLILFIEHSLISFNDKLYEIEKILKLQHKSDTPHNIIKQITQINKQISATQMSSFLRINNFLGTPSSVLDKTQIMSFAGIGVLGIKDKLKKEISKTLELNLVAASEGLSLKLHSVIIDTCLLLKKHIEDELYLSVEYLDSLMNYLASYSFNSQKRYSQLTDIMLRNEQLAKRLCDIMPKTNINNMY